MGNRGVDEFKYSATGKQCAPDDVATPGCVPSVGTICSTGTGIPSISAVAAVACQDKRVDDFQIRDQRIPVTGFKEKGSAGDVTTPTGNSTRTAVAAIAAGLTTTTTVATVPAVP